MPRRDHEQESGETPLPGMIRKGSGAGIQVPSSLATIYATCRHFKLSQEAVCKKWKAAVVVSQLRTVLLESFEVLAAADAAEAVNGDEAAAWPEALVEAHARLVMAVGDLLG